MWTTLLGCLSACAPDPAGRRPDPPAPVVPSTPPDWTVGLSEVTAVAARHLDVASPIAVDLAVTFTDGEGDRTLRFPERTTSRGVTLVGFRAGATTTLRFTGTSADGVTFTAGPVEVEVPPPPPEFPLVEVVALAPARVEPGWTLLDVAAPADEALAWAVLVDEAWRPVWWMHHAGGGVQDLELRPDGTIRGYGLQERGVVTWDLAGEVVEALLPGEGALAGVTGVHHEVVWGDDGSFALLDEVGVTVDAFPRDYDRPYDLGGPTPIADTAIRFYDADRTLVDTWSVAERLQTTRIGIDSLNPTDVGYDWVHGNALAADGDGWLLSMRHQDAIARFGPDGAVDWILGTPSGWSAPWDDLLLAPVGAVTWPHHQHGLHVAGDEITTFDNRTETRTPYDATAEVPRYAQVVRYRVDPVARTVEQVLTLWDTAVGPLEVKMLGDADPLPTTGGVLATFGFVEGEGGVPNADQGWGEVTAHLVEFAADGTVAAHVRLRSEGEAPTELGFRTYRAERVPTVFPSTGPGRAAWD